MPRHHSIDYIEFTVRDLPAAKAFYTAAFGWAFNDYGPSYAGIRDGDGDGEVGGMSVGEPRGGGPLVVLFSEDLDASAAAVERAGGRIVKPAFEFPGGRRFHFCDPSDNELAVWAKS